MITTVPPGTVLRMAISLDTIERTRLYIVEALEVGGEYVDRVLDARFTRTERNQWCAQAGDFEPAYFRSAADAVDYATETIKLKVWNDHLAAVAA